MAGEFYPTEENLGKECEFWAIDNVLVGCCFPKVEMQGRILCAGIIDNVCLYLKNGRVVNFSPGESMEISGRLPNFNIDDEPPEDIG